MFEACPACSLFGYPDGYTQPKGLVLTGDACFKLWNIVLMLVYRCTRQ
jgi:hypothetical protein